LRTNISSEVFANNYLSNETFFKIQSDVIRELAEEKSCVFLGRCADYILCDHPRCINLFISPDTEDRMKRVAEIEHLTLKRQVNLLKK
jgi:cytidylate kinase